MSIICFGFSGDIRNNPKNITPQKKIMLAYKVLNSYL